jgi:hypothetical protein
VCFQAGQAVHAQARQPAAAVRGSSLAPASTLATSTPAGGGNGAPGGERLNGVAFEGRLEYNYMPRHLSGLEQGPLQRPKKSAIDYQFLRLKFLLNKVRASESGIYIEK